MSPGIILTSEFSESQRGSKSQNKGFGKYVEYLDRPDAVEFENYTDYMGNDEKSEGIFTETSNNVTKAEKKQLKEMFQLADKNGSVMEKLVFSFTDEWLIENGIKNKDGLVRTELLQEYTRKAIRVLQKSEKGLENFIWSAAIHHNTDNLHIHVAMVELTPSWTEGKGRCFKLNNVLMQRGIITESSLKKCKATFTNQVIKSAEKNNEINDIIRKRIVAKDRVHESISDFKEIKIMLKELIDNLPANKSLWKYNMNAMAGFRDTIDNISRHIIENSCKADFELLENKLDELTGLYKKAYGATDEKQESLFDYKTEAEELSDFKKNKIDDLYQRLGNTILKECIKISKEGFPDNKISAEVLPSVIEPIKNINSDIKETNTNLGDILRNSIGSGSINLPATPTEENTDPGIKLSDEETSVQQDVEYKSAGGKKYDRYTTEKIIGAIYRMNAAFRKDIESLKNQAVFEYNERMEAIRKEQSR